jgi:sulfur-carrier protein
MPRIVVASAISRWVNHPEGLTVEVTCKANSKANSKVNGESTEGKSTEATSLTVRDLLGELFSQFPILRGYILDETNTMRHHVTAFVAGVPIADKSILDDRVPDNSELYIFQALSGG